MWNVLKTDDRLVIFLQRSALMGMRVSASVLLAVHLIYFS